MKIQTLSKILLPLLVLSALTPFSMRPLSSQPTISQGEYLQLPEPLGPVYFVRVFGGDFPIPVSYELNVDAALSETPTRLEFGSPAIPLLDNPANLKPYNMGAITIGFYREYRKRYGEPYAEASSVRTLKCYGLSVLIATPTDPKFQRLGYTNVFIHDNEQYVEINAVNGSLWKELLRRFGETVEIPAGRECSAQ